MRRDEPPFTRRIRLNTLSIFVARVGRLRVKSRFVAPIEADVQIIVIITVMPPRMVTLMMK